MKIGILIARLAVPEAFDMAGRSPHFLVKTIKKYDWTKIL